MSEEPDTVRNVLDALGVTPVLKALGAELERMRPVVEAHPEPAMTDRWTAETEELVAQAVDRHWRDSYEDPGSDQTPAQVILAALADAGLLLAPGGETREEWGVVHKVFGIDGPIVARADMPDANEDLASRLGRASGLPLVRRTVHVGPWLPVSDGGGA